MLRSWRSGMLYKPDNGAGSGSGDPNQGGGATGAGTSGQQDSGTQSDTPTFETWYGALEAPQKALLDGHVSGLKSALNTERQNRADLAKQIKDLAVKAEKGSELEKQLSDAGAKLEAAERRAAFAEDAIRPEIGCSNVKAAYALALAEGLFNSRGQADWNAIKAAAPELFKKPGAGSADGGAGAQQQPRMDMNAIIRRAAGRG